MSYYIPKNRSEEQKKASMINTEKIDAMGSIYHLIFDSFAPNFGKMLSKKERSEKKLFDTALIYGEIDYDSFAMALQKIFDIYGQPGVGASGEEGVLQSRGGIFYDLGSGVGKAVVAAACLYNFDVCCGIELLEELHKGAKEVQAIYDSKGKNELERAYDTVVEMRQGDMLDKEVKSWSDGDVVFMNSTCYDDKLMTKLAHLAVEMKRGSFVITLSKKLPSKDFQICEYEMHDMSWGTATVYIQQKITDAREYDSDEYDSENDL